MSGETPGQRIVRETIERWSDDEPGSISLDVYAGEWKRFWADLTQRIDEAVREERARRNDE